VARESPGCNAVAQVDDKLKARRNRLWSGGLHASTTARLCDAVLHLEESRDAAAPSVVSAASSASAGASPCGGLLATAPDARYLALLVELQTAVRTLTTERSQIP
jgi:hypothetical protein